MAQRIKHLGTVENIDGAHLRVRVVQSAACAGCVAKQLCRSAESKEKTIDVYSADAATFRLGEQVEVWASLSQGFRAVAWAYCVPLVVLLAVLFVSIALTGNEAEAALYAILSLVPYYLIIYAMRNKFAKEISFSLKHLN